MYINDKIQKRKVKDKQNTCMSRERKGIEDERKYEGEGEIITDHPDFILAQGTR